MRAMMAIFMLPALGCGPPAPMPPRVAAALGGRLQGCTQSCSNGTWCDAETGACVGNSSSSTGHDTHAVARAELAPGPGLGFRCRTAEGLDDEVVASDVDAAARACTALEGAACACVPSIGATSD